MAATTIARTDLVLEAARDQHQIETAAAVRKLQLALEWAQLHPGEPVDESLPGHDRDLEVAGPGAPTVSEFAIAEFALAIGLSADQGIAYVGDAVELANRLPRTWQLVLGGEVVTWKAR